MGAFYDANYLFVKLILACKTQKLSNSDSFSGCDVSTECLVLTSGALEESDFNFRPYFHSKNLLFAFQLTSTHVFGWAGDERGCRGYRYILRLFSFNGNNFLLTDGSKDTGSGRYFV